MKRLVLWTQNLTLLEDQGLRTQTLVLHCSCAKAASFTFQFQVFKNVKRPLPLFTSGIYYSHDMHEALLKNDFSKFSGHLNIEEFFQWFFEVERLFEYTGISDKKKVMFVAHKLKKAHGISGRNCK